MWKQHSTSVSSRCRTTKILKIWLQICNVHKYLNSGCWVYCDGTVKGVSSWARPQANIILRGHEVSGWKTLNIGFTFQEISTFPFLLRYRWGNLYHSQTCPLNTRVKPAELACLSLALLKTEKREELAWFSSKSDKIYWLEPQQLNH